MYFRTLFLSLYLVLPTLAVLGGPQADLDTLINQGLRLYKKQPDKAIAFGHEVLQQNNPQYNAHAAHLLLKTYERMGQMDSASQYGALTLQWVASIDDPVAEASYIERYAKVLRNTGRADEALELYQRSLDIYTQLADTNSMAYVENSIGISYKKMGHYAEALDHYRKALNIRQQLNQQRQIAMVTNNIGNVLRYQGELDSALSHYLRALEVFEAIPDSSNMTNALNNIGLVHENSGYPDKALEYYHRVRTIRKLLKNERGLAAIRNNIAIIFRKANEQDSALAYFELNLKYAQEHGLAGDEALALHNIASVHMDAENWSEAIAGFEQALAIRTELTDRYGIASCNQNLGESYRRMGNPKAAIPYAESALRLSKEIGSIRQTATIYKTLHKAHAALGNFEKAYSYQAMQKAISDSSLAEERAKTIAEMEALYESEKKAQQITLANQQNELQQEKIKRQQTTRNYLILVIGLGLIIVLVYIQRTRILRKANNELMQQKEALGKNAQEKEMLLNEIHHRVKNNLQVVSSLLNMQSRDVTEPKVLDALKEGRDRVHSMALVHQMFYQEHDEAASIEVDKYIEQLCNSLMRSYGAKEQGIDLKLEVQQGLLDIDRATLIGLIVNELVSNSLKYAFEGRDSGELTVTFRSGTKNYILKVADNGTGTNMSQAPSDSFGLKLVESMSKKLKGKVSTVSNGGYSTRIEFPKTK